MYLVLGVRGEVCCERALHASLRSTTDLKSLLFEAPAVIDLGQSESMASSDRDKSVASTLALVALQASPIFATPHR